MVRKYDKIDAALLTWLRTEPKEFTTTDANAFLRITNGIAKRHISRRFTLLEDRGALVCSLRGTTRVCNVLVEKLPDVLHKGGPNNRTWRGQMHVSIHGNSPDAPAQFNGANGKHHKPTPRFAPPKVATSSVEEFLAAGGQIEVIPNHWDSRAKRKKMGPATFEDYVTELD